MAGIIVLKSSDDQLFKVDINVAKMATLIKEMLDNLGDPEEGKEEIIPVQVEGDILEKVLEWAEYHFNLNKNNNGINHDNNDNGNAETDAENEMSEWNQKFLKIENEILYAITRAANFLDMKGLLDVCCEAVANLIQGKTPRQIRELLGLPWPTLDKEENAKSAKKDELEKSD